MNLNTRDLQRIKQNHSYNNRLSSNDTDIFSDEDEPIQSQNMKNQNSNMLKDQFLALQYPTKTDYCIQQVPLFDPSFFKYKTIQKYFHYFFLPEDTQTTIETIKSQQKQDPVLQKVYHWLTNNKRPLQIDPTIASNSFLSVYYKLFNRLYINHDTKIFHIDYPNIHDSNPNQKDKICYHLHSLMQLSKNFMHMDTLKLKYL